MNIKTAFAIFSTLASISLACPAESFVKDGKPCMKEICMGDGLAELALIKWEPSKEWIPIGKSRALQGLKPTAIALKNAKEVFRGDQKAIVDAVVYLTESQNFEQSVYATTGSFDSYALPFLAKITAACQRNSFQGMYINHTGLKTYVRLSLVPIGNGETQKWTVTDITRVFPVNLSDRQNQELNKQIETDYKQFDMMLFGPYHVGYKPPIFYMRQGQGKAIGNLREGDDYFLKNHSLCSAKGGVSLN